MKIKPSKILIVLHGSIGDVTRAIPLANLIKRAYPKAVLAWAVEPLAFPLLQNLPAIDEIILFDRRCWWRSAIPFLREIRSKGFEMVLDLQRHFKSGLVSWCSGAPYRLGFHRRDAKEFNWLFNNLHIPASDHEISKFDHYLRFAAFLDIEPRPIEWGFELTIEEEKSVRGLLRGVNAPFAAIFVGSSWKSKQWFPGQTAKTAALLHDRFGLDIVLLGGEGDVSFAGEVAGFVSAGLRNLVGRTSLREAIGVLRRAELAVGPDTGLMHLSAAVGTPVVSLWGATSPVRTGPYGNEQYAIRGKADCSPCYLRDCPIGRICMQSIGIDEVATKVEKILFQKTRVYGSQKQV
ncbi:MAG: glycosyltransferase family 9 protein [Deltaproteobacteria bacterium]|nr:glycosyltransferase family 9 protein [Deltaproteobacteria bacterium]